MEIFGNQSLRESFGEALVELGNQYDDLRVLDAGTRNSTMSEGFQRKYPDRFYTAGINEPGMIGIATGLAMAGKRVIVSDMSIFLQHAHAHLLTAARQKQGLHLIVAASHTGVAVGPDGGSAHDVTDIARMRLIPDFTVISPWDSEIVRKSLKTALEEPGYYYIRLNRPKVPTFTPPSFDFKIGKTYKLKSGSRVTIVAAGDKVYTALQVAAELGEGIAEVIGVATFEPFDRAPIVESARHTGRVITIEDHISQGGLFESVAGVLAEDHPTRMMKLAVPRKYTTSGEPDELAKMYQIDKSALLHACVKFLA